MTVRRPDYTTLKSLNQHGVFKARLIAKIMIASVSQPKFYGNHQRSSLNGREFLAALFFLATSLRISPEAQMILRAGPS
jgi:hypothetical protein